MVAGVTKGLFTCLDPQVSHQVGVGLDRVSLVVVVCRIHQFEPQIIPDGSYDELADVEDVHASLRTSKTLYVQGPLGIAQTPDILFILQDGRLELFGVAGPQKGA